jgi:hypothetical protein
MRDICAMAVMTIALLCMSWRTQTERWPSQPKWGCQRRHIIPPDQSSGPGIIIQSLRFHHDRGEPVLGSFHVGPLREAGLAYASSPCTHSLRPQGSGVLLPWVSHRPPDSATVNLNDSETLI